MSKRDRKLIAYRLTPIYEEPGAIACAVPMTCHATGRLLSGTGGGGLFLAPDIVTVLRGNERIAALLDEALAAERLRVRMYFR